MKNHLIKNNKKLKNAKNKLIKHCLKIEPDKIIQFDFSIRNGWILLEVQKHGGNEYWRQDLSQYAEKCKGFGDWFDLIVLDCTVKDLFSDKDIMNLIKVKQPNNRVAIEQLGCDLDNRITKFRVAIPINDLTEIKQVAKLFEKFYGSN